MTIPLILAGIIDSLRSDPFNTQLLNGSKNLPPENVEVEILSIANLPICNADVDFPQARHLPEMLLRVDNYSIPDGLNNVIDWTSLARILR